SVFDEVGIPREADVYLCGPTRFMADMHEALAALDVAPERIHVEIFNGSESMTPGVVGAATRAPHLPNDDANTGPLVSFARSGIAVHWKASAYQSILELAEACDVPVRWSCRTGVCHNCESGLVSGAVAYGPQPLEKPADGNLLVCCSHPIRDVVIDLRNLSGDSSSEADSITGDCQRNLAAGGGLGQRRSDRRRRAARRTNQPKLAPPR